MYAYVYEGRRYDTGDKLGFLKATVEFALKRNDLGGPFREYLKELEAVAEGQKQISECRFQKSDCRRARSCRIRFSLI